MMNPALHAMGVLVALLALASPGRTQVFTDVAVAAGLDVAGNFNNVNMDRGAGFADLDGDGDQDLVVSAFPGQPVRCWRNEGNGTFSDQTATAGFGSLVKGRAVVFADVENDGDLDVYLTQTWAPNRLYLNDGSAHFVEAGAAAGVDHNGNGFAATFGDFDRDGWIDLYVGNHSTIQGVPLANVLYRNDGDGTFTDVTAAAGVANPGGPTLATMFLDYDRDGWPDLFVANDWHPIPGYTRNTMFRNNGNGTFTDVSAATNTGFGIQSMGMDFIDAFGDGGVDFAISNIEDGHLFHEWNAATQRYDERAAAYGVQAFQLGWAVHFLDYDNNGWPDLYVNHSEAYGASGTNTLFRNPGTGSLGGVWPQVAGALGLGMPGRYFTSAVADFDDDGRQDILQLRNYGPGLLYRNGVAAGHWIRIRAAGTRSNRAGLGAEVAITAGGRTQRQAVRSGAGFMGADDLRLHFGLGGATVVDRIEVRWPSGQVQYLTGVPADQAITVEEPRIRLSAPPLLGTAPDLLLSIPGDGTRNYVLAAGLAPAPGVPLPDGRTIPLNPDWLVQVCLLPGNPVIPGSLGLLDGSGSAQSPLVLPAFPALAGLTIHVGALTGDAGFPVGIRTIYAPPLPITLQ